MRLCRPLLKLTCVTLLACVPALAPAAVQPVLRIPHGDFVTLAFHDVRDNVKPAVDHDPYAISTDRLAQFFDWMQEHNWHPVSVQQIIDAHNGVKPLPDNAVLLSFDDGLESIYTKVFPLLQTYHYPALFALETGWLRRVHASAKVLYHGESLPLPQKLDESLSAISPNVRKPGMIYYNGSERGASGFVTWAQVREMEDSGLAEFATHTNDLHHGILANPQGNLEPAAITRLYDMQTGTYEKPARYRRRIRDDLRRSIRIIRAHTGHRPRVVVWPYGAMNREVNQIAESLGLKVSFGLADGHVSTPADLHDLGRFLIGNDPEPVAIEAQVGRAITHKPRIQRAVQIDLDNVYDPDPAQVNRNLSKLLDRIKAMHVRTVYLQAFADPDGDGTASALYFPNHSLPMRADLFNRVAWQLKTRANVNVYAWLPLLAFDLPDKSRQHRLDVKVTAGDGTLQPSPHADRRLSPFLPQSLKIVRGIYRDLARNTPAINGVLINDDAYLAADEDASSCEAQARWPGNGHRLINCHLDARQKTEALIDFSRAAVAPMRHYVNQSNRFQVARNLYARVVMDPSAEKRFAQALGPFLANYDEVALMAMPYLDGTRKPPQEWLHQLATRVAARPGALKKVVFELQARDWRIDRWIQATTLRDWMRSLIRLGGVNLAYYPDNFLDDKPLFGPTFVGISLADFPHNNGGK